jgi:signal transduction histidine kinase
MAQLNSFDFTKIFDYTPGIFLVLLPDSPKFTIIAANKARMEATKTNKDQIGRGLFEMFPDNPDDPNASGEKHLRHSLEQVIENLKPNTMAVQKYDIPRPESEGGGFEEKYWSPINSPVLDDNGKLLYIIHQVEDVTEFIRLKQRDQEQSKITGDLKSKVQKTEAEVFVRAQEIQKTNLELQVAHKNLRELYGKVQEVDKIKMQFFSNVSHELRTPLTLILGPTETMLNEDHLTSGDRRNLEIIQRNSRILLKHVNDLLDVAKMEAGKMTISYFEVDLVKQVRFAMANFESAMESKKINFHLTAPDHLTVQVDDEKIQNILMNIFSNALKYVQNGGRVECLVKKDNLTATIEISDNGPGIPREQRKSIFDRFKQGDGSLTRLVGGTGLGLSIVKDFVELHNGRVEVTETPGGGTTLTINIPLLAPLETEVKKTESINPSQHGVVQLTEENSNQHVTLKSLNPGLPFAIVVEDNPDMREFIFNTLKEEFQVITASNGEDGLEKIFRLKPDVILTDVMMPKMSGDKMVEEIRKNPDFNSTSIILLTAKIDDDLKIKLLGDGCQDYLSKPFSRKELLLRTRNLVVMKKSTELLSSELSLKSNDIYELSRELSLRKRELQNSLDVTSVALEQAEKASEMKNRLLTTISHELKTPLTTLILNAELVRRKEKILHSAINIKRILDSSKRLLELIENLLDYADLESGKLTINEALVDPEDIINKVSEEVREFLQLKNLILEVQTSSIRPIHVDPRLVHIILHNLLTNAIKYTAEGIVSINVAVEPKQLILSVSDTGAGISKENLTRIFEPFEQLESIRHKGLSGVGLGLSFVKGVIDALDGKCEVHSELGKGSVFTVTIPCY